MKPLSKTFKYGGFDFQLLKRVGRVALLVKAKPRMSVSYELVILQERPTECVGGRDYPPRESLPRTSSWGRLGWSYGRNERERAEMKLRDLTQSAESALQGSAKTHHNDESMLSMGKGLFPRWIANQ